VAGWSIASMPRKSENSSRKNRLWMKPGESRGWNIRPIGRPINQERKHAPGATPPEVPSTLKKSGLAKRFRLWRSIVRAWGDGKKQNRRGGASPCTQSSVRGRKRLAAVPCLSTGNHRQDCGGDRSTPVQVFVPDLVDGEIELTRLAAVFLVEQFPNGDGSTQSARSSSFRY